MKVLITGGNGFLGTYFVEQWKSQGHEIYTLGRAETNDIKDDLKNSIPRIIQQIDYVIHIAGKAHSVPKTKEEESDFYNVNVNGTSNLLKSLAHKNIKGFMFVSSVAVYGVKNGENISEDTNLAATDPYGKTKIDAEKMILEWGLENNTIISIIRPPLIIGKNAPGNLGKMIAGIKNGRYVNIANGKAKRSVVLAEDIAFFSLKLITVGGIYNLTDGLDASFEQLSNKITKAIGKGKVKNIPFWVANIIAKVGDLIEISLKKEAPFSTKKLKQMTTDLTFSSKKASEIGWRPRGIIENVDIYIS